MDLKIRGIRTWGFAQPTSPSSLSQGLSTVAAGPINLLDLN
jgi:hypothetical protein